MDNAAIISPPGAAALTITSEWMEPVSYQKARRGCAAENAMRMALACATLAAIMIGGWFALSPSIEKSRMNGHQADLLESIERGDGTVAVSGLFSDGDVDYYDSGDGSATDRLASVAATGTDFAAFGPCGAVDRSGINPDATDHPLSDKATADTAETHDTGISDISEQPDDVITGIGILTIEKIGLRLPVSEGVTVKQLKVGPGHVPQTPQIGSPGSALIAGHRSYTYGRHFNRLGEMAVGDPIQYQSLEGAAMEFVVIEILSVPPGDPAILWQPEDGGRLLTLLTCTPVRVASHRLLIRARLIQPETSPEAKMNQGAALW